MFTIGLYETKRCFSYQLDSQQIKSLICECRCCLIALFRQERPRSPLKLTILLQWYVCGSQFTPTSSPTATLITSLSRWRPIAVIGDSYNQSPECDKASCFVAIVGCSAQYFFQYFRSNHATYSFLSFERAAAVLSELLLTTFLSRW